MTALLLDSLPQPRQRRRKGTPAATATNRAAIYIRCSVERSAEETSTLESQERACRALCEARGLEVAGVLVDRGHSGGTLDRPALTELRAQVAAGKVAVVVVYALDRLSRSQAHTLALLEEFEQAGAGLAAASQPFDSTSASGRALLGMLAVFAELQRAEIRSRTKQALAAKRQRGEATNRTPYGLARSGAVFVRCPDTWANVERMLRERIDGRTCEEIARDLNADGVATPSGVGRWYAAGVARLARNPLILDAARDAPAA